MAAKKPGFSEEADYLELTLDDGETLQCEIIGTFDCNGKEYIALSPASDGTEAFEDQQDALIFEYQVTGEDGFDLVDIESDEEFDAAAKAFYELMETLSPILYLPDDDEDGEAF